MVINKKRIQKTKFLEAIIKSDQAFMVAVSDTDRFKEKLLEIGFTGEENETVLPAVVGPTSSFNADGKSIKRKDLPKETAYRQVEWHWKQWAGYQETEDMTDIRDVPYERYQREFIQPPSIELTSRKDASGRKIVVSPKLIFSSKNEEQIKHIVNLFLEIFGECEFLTDGLEQIIKIPTRRVNWQILPEGEMPWEKFYNTVKKVVDEAPGGNRPVIVNRLESIYGYKPDFRAIGKAGFNGYVIFGFEKAGIYVCESIFYGNATYVFDRKWEDLSKLTKAEILNAKLQEDRLIHRKGWDEALKEVMEENLAHAS